MEKRFFIFIGRSGSGKGTQAALLKALLESKYSNPVRHITTGGGFRDFINSDNHAAKLARKVNEQGGLQPEFLAVWNWANIFITTLQGDETIILDGAPRKLFEANILHSAISFFGYTNPIVIYLDVSETVSRDHLVKRGRDDDTEGQITGRMGWFETDVLPALESYRNDPRYRVLHINGEKTIEEVHKEIVEKLEIF